MCILENIWIFQGVGYCNVKIGHFHTGNSIQLITQFVLLSVEIQIFFSLKQFFKKLHSSWRNVITLSDIDGNLVSLFNFGNVES